jgi:phosphoglycolate phosphatase-like HAD superfamily hydrolase
LIKAVVFDFDGVLIESVDIKTKAFGRLFEKEGKMAEKAVVEYHLKHTGVSRFEKFKYIYKMILKRELTGEKFDELCRHFSELVVTEVIAAPYVKGAKEFLDAYSASYKCFVASATPQQEIEDIIRKRGMEKYFAGVYGAPTMKTDAVKGVVDKYHFDPGEVLYVGDAISDYEAAVVNKIHFIARINGNEDIFRAIDCVKAKDLSGLKSELVKIKN